MLDVLGASVFAQNKLEHLAASVVALKVRARPLVIVPMIGRRHRPIVDEGHDEPNVAGDREAPWTLATSPSLTSPCGTVSLMDRGVGWLVERRESLLGRAPVEAQGAVFRRDDVWKTCVRHAPILLAASEPEV